MGVKQVENVLGRGNLSREGTCSKGECQEEREIGGVGWSRGWRNEELQSRRA